MGGALNGGYQDTMLLLRCHPGNSNAAWSLCLPPEKLSRSCLEWVCRGDLLLLIL